VASDHKAVGPTRRAFAVKSDTSSPLEKHAENDARLDTGEGSPDAVVDTASERHVASRNLPLEIDLVGSFENRRVAVSGAPQQQDGGSGRDIDSTECGVPGRDTHVVAERRFEA